MESARLLAIALSMTGISSLAWADTDLPAPSAASGTVAPVQTEDIVTEPGPWTSVTPFDRLRWFDEQTFSISNLGGSIPDAVLQTSQNRPREAGAHWSGFAERYGVSISTNFVSNAMEASVGALWGEDPRYRRAGSGTPFRSRLGHVFTWTVVAPNRSGELRPAWARFVAFSSSTFITNAWREPSDTTLSTSFGRIGFALLGRMGSNAFDEFWPDTKRRLFHHNHRD
jgi:hypothetical protein